MRSSAWAPRRGSSCSAAEPGLYSSPIAILAARTRCPGARSIARLPERLGERPWLAADIHRRPGGHDQQRPVLAQHLVAGAAVLASREAQVDRRSPDPEVPERHLGQRFREPRPDDRQEVERRERIQPEHQLDELHDGARRPGLRRVGTRIGRRADLRLASMAGQRLRQPCLGRSHRCLELRPRPGARRGRRGRSA